MGETVILLLKKLKRGHRGFSTLFMRCIGLFEAA